MTADRLGSARKRPGAVADTGGSGGSVLAGDGEQPELDLAGAVRRRKGAKLSFPAVARTSVGLQSAELIKGLIVSGQLKPGDALPPERDLAVMLKISRPSLREALRILVAMNVLTARHGGGTYVTSLEPKLLARPVSFLLQVNPMAFKHLFEVRQVLEVGAARLAAEKISDEEVDELATLTAAAEAVLSRPSKYLHFDFEIHSKIIEATNNPIYLSLYASIADLSIESRKKTARSAAVRQQAHADHVAIVDALRRRDPVAAGRAMHNHLSALERVITTRGDRQ